MFRVTIIRSVCWALSFVILICTWAFVSKWAVNITFEGAEIVVRGAARGVATLFSVDKTWATAIALDKMGADRTLIISSMMIVLLVVWGKVRGYSNVGEIAFRIFLGITVVHFVLAFCWIVYGEQTEAVYIWHQDRMKVWFRSQGWDGAETVMIRGLHVYKPLIIGELLFAYAVLVLSLTKLNAWIRRRPEHTPAI